jgi:hypothetical protein
MRQVIGRLEAFAEQVRGKLHAADWAMRRQLRACPGRVNRGCSMGDANPDLPQ